MDGYCNFSFPTRKNTKYSIRISYFYLLVVFSVTAIQYTRLVLCLYGTLTTVQTGVISRMISLVATEQGGKGRNSNWIAFIQFPRLTRYTSTKYHAVCSVNQTNAKYMYMASIHFDLLLCEGIKNKVDMKIFFFGDSTSENHNRI